MPAHSYVIRTPEAAEAEAVDQVWAASQQPDNAGAWNDGIEPLSEWATCLRVLTVDEQLAGCYGFRREEPAGEGWIRVGVVADYRNDEYGGALLDDAVRLCEKEGVAGIRLPMRGITQWIEPIATARGFHPERAFLLMSRPSDAPALVERAVPGVQFRPMQSGEEGAVLAALNRAWATTEHYEPITADHLERDLVGQRDGMLLGVADADPGEIVATCHAILRRGETDDKGRIWGWISNLTSLPEWRGRGVGRAMLTTGLLYLYRNGAGPVGLGVDGDSQGPIDLYQSTGFVVTDRLLIWANDMGA